MATQHYAYQLECPRCEAAGHAYGSDDDNGPNFTIDEVSKGFSARYSPNPFAQSFTHSCGTEARHRMEDIS